ncbi:cAMP-binding domain of CRP or a regulatory subunit of cAMP-dependent protein kinases [Filimonas lacunae]|uniref:cAMP-binding domain of CRP or a regulatory subunit of cAMP-dependent protein kinases n=1 Tax=Filimonas lacunae TaxID=477680 RepID=A0A173MDH3_9BACT|nr:Crp/Fnr family transcriptional regulator [Filimonas lacunae]BAV05529.1 Crp/Fnr family transcriptional regulator [Filimonas lacunae]SIT20541.1 cAMP-binding domain of CRP or a regulatory subunit of cAMP-dependent protein kinases [Filimonas lacunae]
MFDFLFTHIETKTTLTEQDKEAVPSFFTVKKFRRKQFLLQEGEVCKQLSFIVKGLIKTYNVDEKGEDHINMFGWEGWWISDFYSFLRGTPALLNIEAIEPTEILAITLDNYEAMLAKVPIMERYFRILYQNSILTKERRLMSTITHTAEEKYLQLQQQHPEMLQRIPQNLIASYLGLAPETISRIKRNIADKK